MALYNVTTKVVSVFDFEIRRNGYFQGCEQYPKVLGSTRAANQDLNVRGSSVSASKFEFF